MRKKIFIFVLSLMVCIFATVMVALELVHRIKVRDAESKVLLEQRLSLKFQNYESRRLLESVMTYSLGDRDKAMEEYYDAKTALLEGGHSELDPDTEVELARLRKDLALKVGHFFESAPKIGSMEFKLRFNELNSISESISLKENKILEKLNEVERTAAQKENTELRWGLSFLSVVFLLSFLIVAYQVRKGSSAILALEADRADVQARLQESARLALLGEMSASIAHEIKGPLGVLSGRLDILKSIAHKGQSWTPEEMTLFAVKCGAMVERITKTITSVQRAAHRQSSEMTAVPLSDILKENLDLCLDKANRLQASLTMEPAERPIMVQGNSVELSQAMLNLINNALDAVEPLSEKWVKVSMTTVQDRCVIKICDAGKGIPVEIQSKLFQNFFTTKPVGKGTGLGLGICQRIIQNHGGSLQLDNAAKNTTFVIELPALAA
jgi:C4-dicarboxylate-specific signal transduction histidine kinase